MHRRGRSPDRRARGRRCRMRAAFGIVSSRSLIREVAEVGAGRDHRGDAVIGVALQVVDVILAREVLLRHLAGDHVEEARMAVRVDDARDDGLAGEIDARARPPAPSPAPLRPTCVMRLPSTTKAESSIGAPPSPVIRRAHSKRVAVDWAWAAKWRKERRRENARRIERNDGIIRRMTFLPAASAAARMSRPRIYQRRALHRAVGRPGHGSTDETLCP